MCMYTHMYIHTYTYTYTHVIMYAYVHSSCNRGSGGNKFWERHSKHTFAFFWYANNMLNYDTFAWRIRGCMEKHIHETCQREYSLDKALSCVFSKKKCQKQINTCVRACMPVYTRACIYTSTHRCPERWEHTRQRKYTNTIYMYIYMYKSVIFYICSIFVYIYICM